MCPDLTDSQKKSFYFLQLYHLEEKINQKINLFPENGAILSYPFGQMQR